MDNGLQSTNTSNGDYVEGVTGDNVDGVIIGKENRSVRLDADGDIVNPYIINGDIHDQSLRIRQIEAHNHALALWHKLNTNLYRDSIHDIVNECRDWWYLNCLFLTPEAKEAFQIAYQAAGNHAMLVEGYRHRQVSAENVHMNRLEIIRARDIIQLPIASLG